MTRSGNVYPIEISNEILQRAIGNTVDYLVKHIEVADRKDEPTISKMEQVDKDTNVRSKDEPQTDGILFKGNLKEGEYKLIKTTNGWVLEGNDIAYYGEPQTDCLKAGKWYSFSDYVVEMQGEVKPTAFRIMPLEHYTNQTERSE
jgi:hypothetical protein